MIFNSARRLWQHFLDDHLFRNSIYLMATTGFMGLFGYVFWIICTHIFQPDQIGVGTTLISAMSLISSVSLLGFNNTFIRILPNSQNRDNEINTGSILVILTSATMALLYIAAVPVITPKLSIIHENPWFALGFVIIVALASLNTLTDSVFIAYRAAHFNLITDGFITSITKLILPVIFVTLGAYGVFASAGLAAGVGIITAILILVFKYGYKPRFHIDSQTLKKVFRYSFTNYLANLLSIAPTLILPIIVIDHLGAAAAGYYYLTFMIINLLYTVAASVSQSLFAEGSYDTNGLRGLLKNAVKMLLIIMVPAGIVLAIGGPYVLELFGKSYGAGGAGVLIVFALAAPAVAAYNIACVVLRIRHQTYSLVFVNILYAVLINVLAILWVDRGLVWIAIAWLIGNLIAAALAFVSIFYYRHLPTPTEITTA